MAIGIGEATGWIGAALVFAAGSVPVGHRLLRGRRPALDALPVRSHVIVGVAAAAGAFGHALAILPSLGSPEAIGAGTLALASGAVAILVLMAHVGVGLRLRNPKLKRRPKLRRTHVMTASTIVIAVAVHVVMLLRAS